MTVTSPLPTRRRPTVSVSSPVTDDPVARLDEVVEACLRVNRVLPGRVLGREELIAVAGLLTQVSAALVRLTDLLGPAVAYQDRVRCLRVAGGDPASGPALVDCRDGYVAAWRAARALHAGLKRRTE
ncbi:MAG: hypothetical protein ACRDTZ_00165 [Pseudonocardiaceae bacterium]